ACFVLFMAFVARPILVRYFTRSMAGSGGERDSAAPAGVFVGGVFWAPAAEPRGIFSAVVPVVCVGVLGRPGVVCEGGAGELREAAASKLHDVVTGFFVPVFFTYTGLRTDVTSLNGVAVWLILVGVIVAAVVGKLVGCGLAARVSGFSWREAGIVGAMMNAR